MKIAAITQLAGFDEDGLGNVSMRQLNRVVVLAGANGSGKSRLLRRVAVGLSNLVHSKYSQCFRLEEPNGAPAVSLISENLDIHDSSDMSANDLIGNASRAETLGAGHLPATTLAYIHRTQMLAWNASHQHSAEDPNVRHQKIANYESLVALIKVFLGVTLKRDGDNRPSLFGKAIAQAALSHGQRKLLQWCTALHAQVKQLDGLVLLMDEPENHLHPDAMLSTIERIIDATQHGQLWIATHSVPLIAGLYRRRPDELSLYFLNNGEISFAGESPELVLTSLMGGAENIEALREFVDLPEVFATNRFAAQCLLAPSVVAGDSSTDPQVEIVSKEIIGSGRVKRILDFGCGKGRVIESLFASHGVELQSKIDYVGWDSSEKDRETFERATRRVYESSDRRWFSERQEFMGAFSAGYFDCILLCNVLHEIPPEEWVAQFNETSIIGSRLSAEGEVLIIEDYLMPKGEYAHEFGFIVLDTDALQNLFGDVTGSIRIEKMRGDRIKGHFIPKSLLSNVTKESVRSALQFAQRNARDKVSELRGRKTHDFRSGRAHGFWIQQFANTTLAME